MVKPEFVREYAIGLENTQEVPHHAIPSYRVKKKIFMTHNTLHNRVCIKLSAVDQDVFSSTNKYAITPVPNKWSKYGWTLIQLDKVRKIVFKDAVSCAYTNVLESSKNKSRK